MNLHFRLEFKIHNACITFLSVQFKFLVAASKNARTYVTNTGSLKLIPIMARPRASLVSLETRICAASALFCTMSPIIIAYVSN